ncbi:MAG: hypothetical protein OHK0039_34190 [Bacteroidia bacterium]
MNFGKIFAYLLLVFGLGTMALQLPELFFSPGTEVGDLAIPLLKMLLYSWTPALAAWTTQRIIFQEPVGHLGWHRRYFSFRWILGAVLVPLVLVAGTVGVTFVLGNVLHIPGFGLVLLGEPSLQALPGPFARLLTLIPAAMPPEVGTLLAIMLVGGIFFGATFRLLFTAGEEMGWRGFMVEETRSLGFLGSGLVNGVLWGLWLLPLQFSSAEPWSWGLETFQTVLGTLGITVALSFPLAYFALKTHSIYASATITGILGNIAIIAGFFIFDADPALAGVDGLAGMLVLLAITWAIITFDKAFVEQYPKLRFRPRA